MNFLRKIFSPCSLIISLVLLFYTFYKSEIHWNGIKNNYYQIYYVISLILIIFSVLTFYFSKKIKDYLVVLTLSIISSLYLFEGYLSLNKSQLSQVQLNKKIKLYEKETGKKYDTRTGFQVYKDLKKINNNIIVSVPPSSSLYKDVKIFPLSGISNSRVIYCNENGYWVNYNSDRFGFRNPDKEWDQKEIEYLLVGDSFAHGACVNSPNDIASVLRTLSNKSVLNLSSDGGGPLTEFATLREYLSSNVKNILWIYYEGNDLKDLNNELSNRILVNYLNDLTFTQNLKKKQNKVNELFLGFIKEAEIRETKKITKFIKLDKLRGILSNLLPEKNQPNYFKPQQEIKPKFKNIMKLAKELISKNNSKLYFVYLPTYTRYETDYDNSNYLEIKKIINELDIPFIDIHAKVFDKEPDPLKLFPFKLVGHYNVIGHKKVAETIYKLSNN